MPEALLARDIGQRMLMKSNVACEGVETVMAVRVGSSAGAGGVSRKPEPQAKGRASVLWES